MGLRGAQTRVVGLGEGVAWEAPQEASGWGLGGAGIL